MSINKKPSSGQSVIEVIIAVAIFVILASGSVTVILGSFLSSRQGSEETQASFYAQEGLDAVKSIRDQSWEFLVDGDHGLSFAGGKWVFNGTSEVLGKYTRKITISPVNRSVGGDIAPTGGTLDPNTKKAVALVTWNFTPIKTSSVEMSSYLTNWQTAFVTPAATATPTPTPVPTPTPTPTPTSCNSVCTNNGYASGICRGNVGQCNNNSETNVSSGNVFCTGGPSSDTCCCKP